MIFLHKIYDILEKYSIKNHCNREKMTAELFSSILQQKILMEKIEIKMIMLTHKGRIHYL